MILFVKGCYALRLWQCSPISSYPVCPYRLAGGIATCCGLHYKGGFHGQGLTFSRSGRFALCWHSYEDKPGSDAILEAVKCLADG